MKYRCIYFKFPSELTERQRSIFIVNWQSVTTKLKEELNKTGAKIVRMGGIPIVGGMYKDGANMLAARFKSVELMVDHYMRLEQVNRSTYRFAYIYDRAALADIEILNKKFHIGDFVQEKKLIEAFRRHVFADMGIGYAEVETKEEELPEED